MSMHPGDMTQHPRAGNRAGSLRSGPGHRREAVHQGFLLPVRKRGQQEALHLLACLLLPLLLMLAVGARAGIYIDQPARLTTSNLGTALSNSRIVLLIGDARLLRHAPADSTAIARRVQPVQCDAGGTLPGPLDDNGDPLMGSDPAAPLATDLPLADAGADPRFRPGEPVFVQILSAAGNTDSAAIDQLAIRVVVRLPDGGREQHDLHLAESDVDSGEFIGYLQDSAGPGCGLPLAGGSRFVVRHSDTGDSTEQYQLRGSIDPFGYVFDARTGKPVNGARIRLERLDGKAQVYGDRGEKDYPELVVSGRDIDTGSGFHYRAERGSWRFPDIADGNYRLVVDPPAGYAFPSRTGKAAIRQLPNGPWTVDDGDKASRGEVFRVRGDWPRRIDIPLDPVDTTALFVTKQSSRDSAAIGDFLQYRIRVENSSGIRAHKVMLHDLLPTGFRLVPGSVRRDDRPAANPDVDARGTGLAFTIGDIPPASAVELAYVVEVTAGVRQGDAVNSAWAIGAQGSSSNTATWAVRVREELMRSSSILVGRVIVDSCDGDPLNDHEGLAGVRLYLEDGTTVVTDEKGRWHVAGIKPGGHVVQVDKESLNPDFELVECVANTRTAGSAFSQFVDVQGGGLWRADFHVRRKDSAVRASAAGGSNVTQRLSSEVADGQVQYRLVVDGSRAEASDLEAVVRLIGDVLADPASFTVDGRPASALDDGNGRLRIPLGNQQGNWQRVIGFAAAAADSRHEARVVSSSVRFRNLRGDRMETGSAVNRFSPDGRGGLKLLVRDSGELTVALPPAPTDADSRRRAPGERAEQPGISSLADGQMVAQRILAVRAVLDARLQPRLLVDGREVSSEQIGFRARDPKANTAVFGYVGVDLGETGPHTVVLEGRDGFGNVRYAQTINIVRTGEIRRIDVLETSGNVADGTTPVTARIALLDEQLRPIAASAELQLVSGDLQPLDADDPANPLARPAGNVTVQPDGTVRFKPVTQAGRYRLTLAWSDSVRKDVDIYVKPYYRDWILVGFAEGSSAYSTLSGNMQALAENDSRDGFSTDGRTAFFARGQVRGEWLLTMAYDTGKERPDGLQDVIDPNAWYTLYGDNSQQQQDAPSQRKLYLKIERDRFQALFGDYDTGLSVTELSSYNRRLNGARGEYVGEQVEVMAFASETSQGFVRDELRGNGTSGIYRLRTAPLVPGSEAIRLETRDRFRSQLVTETRELTRFLDYSIDYDSGAIWFREPVLSQDERFNPVFIVVDYETETGFMNTTGGGRVVMRPADNIELGLTGITEGVGPDGEGRLAGLDATVQLDAHNKVVVEVARTDADDVLATPGDLSTQMPGTGSAHVVRLTHDSGTVAGELYLREQDDGFGLGQQPITEGDTRKAGGNVRYRLGERLSLNGEAYTEQRLGSGDSRDLVEGRVNLDRERDSYYGGLRTVQDAYVATATERRSDQLIGGTRQRFLDDRLELGVDAETTFSSGDQPVDFPHRVLTGADYRLTPLATLFAQQEFTWGEDVNGQNSRAGVRLTPWNGGQLTTALGRQANEYGERVYANAGLLQNWQLNARWTMDAGLDRTETLADSSNAAPAAPVSGFTPAGAAMAALEDFTAVFIGAGFDDNRWSWRGRAESRWGDLEDKQNLFSGLYRELDKASTLAGTLRVNLGQYASGELFDQAVLGLGYAYRPLAGRWILLDQLDFVHERSSNADFDLRGRRLVNNFNGNLQVDDRNQLGLQYAAKYVLDTIDTARYTGYTDIMGVEYRHDLTPRWDAGLRASVLHSWRADALDESWGVFAGFSPVDNVWISLGWNFKGYRDSDFAGAEFRDQGLNLAFRIKFDQESVKTAYDRYTDSAGRAVPSRQP
jgi:uncharacterized repeat protein (TIGR01451 family)